MRHTLYTVLCAALLAGCATADVTRSCVGTQAMAAAVRPGLSASPEASLAADAVLLGSAVCGTPQYAVAREIVLDWARSKGILR